MFLKFSIQKMVSLLSRFVDSVAHLRIFHFLKYMGIVNISNSNYELFYSISFSRLLVILEPDVELFYSTLFPKPLLLETWKIIFFCTGVAKTRIPLNLVVKQWLKFHDFLERLCSHLVVQIIISTLKSFILLITKNCKLSMH